MKNYLPFMIIFSLLLCSAVLCAVWKGDTTEKQDISQEHKNKQLILDIYKFREGRSFFVFPEYRENPILWYAPVPDDKIEQIIAGKLFLLSARPNEFFVYQLGISALQLELNDISIVFSDLVNDSGHVLPAEKMTCFNMEGINSSGNPFTKTITVPPRRVQALWVGIDTEGMQSGAYTGSVSVTANSETQTLPLQLTIQGKALENHGYNEGNRLSRLNWLNSTIGIDDEITKGYTPLTRSGHEIGILGRKLVIDETGLPASITSCFEPSNQFLTETYEPILARPIRFLVEKEDGEMVQLEPGPVTFTKQTPSVIEWSVVNTSPECDLKCFAKMSFEGFIEFRQELTAKTNIQLKDIRLEVALFPEKAKYCMGLGMEGGLRTDDFRWAWNPENHQDALWIGTVNSGLQFRWKAENYTRPLTNIYYKFGKLQMPLSWDNQGHGGVDCLEQEEHIILSAYSGFREMQPDETLYYDFDLHITPSRTICRDTKFNDRYYHTPWPESDKRIETAHTVGANIVNIHHASDVYPFINYPYLDATIEELKQLLAKSHEENIRLKLYYTTRELTKNIPEFWAFNSMNGEIIFPGPGNETRTELLHPRGPHTWYLNHLREKYIPAWYSGVAAGKFQGELDLSVITTPDGRINNFYIAGLDWMLTHLNIDGIYLDDTALDRDTICRARKIIDRHCHDGRIDLHCCHSNSSLFCNANALNIYMELLPFLDQLWLGEGYRYEKPPDYWLIELSGIPFGLPTHLMRGNDSIWKGMVYGSTTRSGWASPFLNHLWKFFDEYQMTTRTMIGYWDDDFPISCSHPLIKATVYHGENDIVLAVANWSGNEETTAIDVDLNKFGLSEGKFKAFVPEIPDFQDEQTSIDMKTITIPGHKGVLIVLEKVM